MDFIIDQNLKSLLLWLQLASPHPFGRPANTAKYACYIFCLTLSPSLSLWYVVQILPQLGLEPIPTTSNKKVGVLLYLFLFYVLTLFLLAIKTKTTLGCFFTVR
jgi:hypothetical protein